jgi:hypothetical protein
LVISLCGSGPLQLRRALLAAAPVLLKDEAYAIAIIDGLDLRRLHCGGVNKDVRAAHDDLIAAAMPWRSRSTRSTGLPMNTTRRSQEW